ncbi:hypothetical protein JHK82_027680 [Glycine max]|nr:hypothetical protein JHK82_027680 [Glycine max]
MWLQSRKRSPVCDKDELRQKEKEEEHPGNLKANHNGLPKSIPTLSGTLSFPRLDNNEFTGPIPDWLGEHQYLQHLGLTENIFFACIPSSLGNVTSLNQLTVSSNLLSGNLPNTIGQLFNLRRLYIEGSLSGVLSEKHISKLFNLESILLNSDFAFNLDPNWIPPFQFHEISLRNTILGPTIPKWLNTQRTLDTLDIYYSEISSINADKFLELCIQYWNNSLVPRCN